MIDQANIILEALRKIGLATPWEIFDYINENRLSSLIDRDDIEDFLELGKIKYYDYEEKFAKRRYTLHPISNNSPPPRILLRLNENGRDKLFKNAREALSLRNIFSQEGSDVIEFCPDTRRNVVFCIGSYKDIDGVIDLRRSRGREIRFPTIVYAHGNKDTTSEWLQACEIYSKFKGINRIEFLRIRGMEL